MLIWSPLSPVSPERVRVLYCIWFQHGKVKSIRPNVAQLAAVLETQRRKALAVVKSVLPNVLDALRNEYLRNSALVEAGILNAFQLRTRLEHNLAQLFAIVERARPELSDAA